MAWSLLAPNGRRYVVEPGVLDDRAALAFTNGHCHSLALALHRKTDGEMVSLVKMQEPFDHILVRSEDGRLIDIGGARTPAVVVTAGGRLSRVNTATLERLPTKYGWAAADPKLASAWLPPLLERVVAGEPHRQIGCFTYDFRLDSQCVIHIEWSERDGAVRLTAFGRRHDDAPTAWTRCMAVRVPKSSEGERLIDFTQRAFDRHARQFEEVIQADRAGVIANLDDPAVDESPLRPPE